MAGCAVEAGESHFRSRGISGIAITFAYDANGQRTKTVQPGGVTTYFPFPGYEETVNGVNTIKRSTYSFAGQTVAMRVTGDPVSGNNGLFYVLSDHLGSTSMLVNSSGGVVAGSTTRNLPYGGYRTTPTQTITDRDFTGQKENRELGLLYDNARFYVPGIGRFASADTLVPDKENPQAYNRYAYVANNPLLLVDESGHCWGFASGMRDWNVTIGGVTYGGGVNCANIDMALSIVQHPDATPEQKAQAGAYLGGWGVAAVSGAAGTGLLVCSTVAPCAAAAETALGIGTAAAADGNPTNEIQAVQTGTHTVYQYVQNGSTRYVGHTNNFFRRAAEHLNSKGWDIRPLPGLNQLSKSDARAVEQVLIERHGLVNLHNKINSISPRNPIYEEAIKRGAEILRKTGNMPQ